MAMSGRKVRTKKEAALPQHYLSPNQIKPNYNFYNKEKL